MDSTATSPMLDRLLAGEEYVADELVDQLTDTAAAKASGYNSSPSGDPAARHALLVSMLGSVGEGVVIRPPMRVDLGTHISIGDRTFVNFGLVALDIAPITIGSDVQIGPNVQLLTPTHPLDAERRRAKWEGGAPITIGDNVWLGGGVIVCPGVTIGENTVVGAGAVVASDLPANVLAVGNPARVIRQL
ncbi:sugar O-acetyltransferase [Nocardioides sp. Y6]|uniref:Sugar O-acetyltransferase n=1 Tax=Nocardioides malaquae TaxID=2773426 RepID=A0ABR9RQ77_9ACTN|nr:sugar O-acetyltransferase [Nocardioides malaquae]MBE7323724.1 sugar O-acetyltransferase [Nocardioides malaquae]